MSSTPYPIRIPDEELAELKSLAAEADVSLSQALRAGARVYLSASPQERAAFDAATEVQSARKSLQASVERAQGVLRSLK